LTTEKEKRRMAPRGKTNEKTRRYLAIREHPRNSPAKSPFPRRGKKGRKWCDGRADRRPPTGKIPAQHREREETEEDLSFSLWASRGEPTGKGISTH
jgi:hypothetical protein